MSESEKQYVASLSYGKDSLAMLYVITDVLHWPLDRIITADVWATDTIPADLPPMVEFKAYADEEIKRRWGIEVEHFCAMANGEPTNYEKQFYTKVGEKRLEARKHESYDLQKCHNENGKMDIRGFPLAKGPWCNSKLKMAAIEKSKKAIKDAIQYIGIAFDEPKRIERHKNKTRVEMPLVEAEWTEQMCREWCEKNSLLSPIYTTSARGGCWFCHNQSVSQLRLLRRNYPELWALILKWDNDSPCTFHADGRTVHDFDERFRWEDDGFLPTEKQFRWADVANAQMNIFQIINDKSGERGL